MAANEDLFQIDELIETLLNAHGKSRLNLIAEIAKALEVLLQLKALQEFDIFLLDPENEARTEPNWSVVQRLHKPAGLVQFYADDPRRRRDAFYAYVWSPFAFTMDTLRGTVFTYQHQNKIGYFIDINVAEESLIEQLCDMFEDNNGFQPLIDACSFILGGSEHMIEENSILEPNRIKWKKLFTMQQDSQFSAANRGVSTDDSEECASVIASRRVTAESSTDSLDINGNEKTSVEVRKGFQRNLSYFNDNSFASLDGPPTKINSDEVVKNGTNEYSEIPKTPQLACQCFQLFEMELNMRNVEVPREGESSSTKHSDAHAMDEATKYETVLRDLSWKSAQGRLKIIEILALLPDKITPANAAFNPQLVQQLSALRRLLISATPGFLAALSSGDSTLSIVLGPLTDFLKEFHEFSAGRRSKPPSTSPVSNLIHWFKVQPRSSTNREVRRLIRSRLAVLLHQQLLDDDHHLSLSLDALLAGLSQPAVRTVVYGLLAEGHPFSQNMNAGQQKEDANAGKIENWDHFALKNGDDENGFQELKKMLTDFVLQYHTKVTNSPGVTWQKGRTVSFACVYRGLEMTPLAMLRYKLLRSAFNLGSGLLQYSFSAPQLSADLSKIQGSLLEIRFLALIVVLIHIEDKNVDISEEMCINLLTILQSSKNAPVQTLASLLAWSTLASKL